MKDAQFEYVLTNKIFCLIGEKLASTINVGWKRNSLVPLYILSSLISISVISRYIVLFGIIYLIHLFQLKGVLMIHF